MGTAAVYQVTALAIGLCDLSPVNHLHPEARKFKYQICILEFFLGNLKKKDNFTKSFHINWPSSADGDR